MTSKFAHKSVLSMGSDDVLLKEIDSCVKEWTRQCGKALLNGSLEDYYMQKNQISTVQEWRRSIQADTEHKFTGARESAIKLIEAQRQLDESFSIPRLDDGELVTAEMGLSIHHLLRLHRFMQERLVEGAFLPSSAKEQFRIEQEKASISAGHSATSGPSHLLVEMQMAMFKINEPYSMYFSIFKSGEGFLTEEFVVSQTELGLPEDKSLMGRLYTIFSNVTNRNMLDEGHLVIKIYRKGCILDADRVAGTTSTTKFQRPFACGVVSLQSIRSSLVMGVQNELPECQIYRPKADKMESTFSRIHEMIIDEKFNELEEIPLSKGLKLCLTLVQGAIGNFKEETFLDNEYSDENLREKLKDSQVTLPLRPDEVVVEQEASRELIYITLQSGEFSQGSKSTAKNIEVTACCVSNTDGTVIPNCISRGAGHQAEKMSTYASTVFYHNNNPNIEETFCINLAAVPDILSCHLFITVAHCSTNTKEKSSKSIFSTKDKKARDHFAFCVLPFSNSKTGGLVIPDGDKVLSCYSLLSSMTLENLQVSVMPGNQVSAYLAENMNLKPRTLKNGQFETVSVSTFVHSVRYVQVKAVSDLMSWRNCSSEEELINVMKSCDDLSEETLAPCIQECIEMTIAILYNKAESNIHICQHVFKLFVKVMNILSNRFNDPSKDMKSFLLMPTPGGRGEKIHKSSIQEKNHKKNQDNLLDAFIQKIFHSTVSAEIVLLRHCGIALTELKDQLLSAGFYPGMYESSLVAIIKDTCLLAHYNFQRNDQTIQSQTISQFTAEIKNIVFVVNQILASANRDNRIMVEIRQQFFEILSISELYLPITEMGAAANQYILTLMSEAYSRSKTVHTDRMKFIRNIIDTNMFLEAEGRHNLLPTIVEIIVENMRMKKDMDGTLNLLQLVLEQIEILGSSAEYVELIQILPLLVDVMLDQSSRLVEQDKPSGEMGGTRGSVRKSVKMNRKSITKERMRRMSCIGNTASVTTNSVRISLENSTTCLCSLLNLLDKENVMKVMAGEYAVVPKTRVSSLPNQSSSSRGGKASPVKAMRVLSLDDCIYEDDKDDDAMKKQTGKDFIISLLTVQTVIVKHLVIPTPWLLLSMMVMKTIQNTILWSTEVITQSSQALIDDLSYTWKPMAPAFDDVQLLYANDDEEIDADTEEDLRLANNLTLWSGIFTLALTVALEAEITLESATINPARLAYLNKHYDGGDIRLPIVQAVNQCWECLPDENLRIRFGESFTIPFLALACSPCVPLATAGKSVVIDLLRSDFIVHKCFSSTASHVYDSVSETLTHVDGGGKNKNHHHNGHKHNRGHQSTLIMEKRYLPSYQPLVDFVGDFSSIFSADSVLNCKYALDFSVEINELKTLLQVLAKYPKTTEFEEERSFAYKKLMEFLLKMNRRDAYIKFAHTLAKEMNHLENYVEAGNAILLHYKLLEWTDDTSMEFLELGEDGIVPMLPDKLAWERKLNLIEMAVDLMDKGKAWEYGIQLLNEIGQLYTTIRPDYLKLSKVLEDQAKLYHRIVTEERYFPTMFRVSYFGRGYESQAIINKSFIYRGCPLESIMDFTNRIKKKYPGCELLAPKVNPTEEEYLNADKQFLQISKVTAADPDEMLGQPGPNMSNLPKYIKSHRQSNDICCFYYQRPFRMNKTKSANEFLDLWVEKKFLRTKMTFPGYTRRAEVTEEAVIVLNPIEMAVIGLEERNASLYEESEEMKNLDDRTASQSYTMSLSGTVDAAVNGGIKNYESFITGSYRQDNPEIAEDIDKNISKKGDLVDRLKQCLHDQMNLLENGIELHREKCLECMIPLHAHVELTFGKMKTELNELLVANE